MTANHGEISIQKQSPFTPGSPVPIEMFVGREPQIAEIEKYAAQATSGRLEALFLLGERGIGKSSIASFARYLASTKHNMLSIQVFLGRVTTIEDTVRQVLEQLLKESRTEKWYDNLKGLFGEHIEQVGLFDISIKFAPPRSDLKEIANDFPKALMGIVDKLGGEKSGIFIALDDIDGLLATTDFANWFKSFVDRVATSELEFPVCMMLIGLPEQRDTLAELQPSLMRIFRVIDIERLSNNEVQGFFRSAFSIPGLEVTDDAMEILVQFSSGLPVIMHELGDATFWKDEDGTIDRDDVLKGLVVAADNVCKKYLTPRVYQAIRSERYRNILGKLGTRELWVSRQFRKRDLETSLTENEKKVFGNFLRKMRELGVIQPDPDGGRGDYVFQNELYPVCIHFEALKRQL